MFGAWENGRKLIWPGQQCRKVGVIGLVFEILVEMKTGFKGPFLIIFEFDFQIMEAEKIRFLDFP